jgi:hypothetical protein
MSARSLEEMPETSRALQTSEISSSAFKLLVRAREVDPQAFLRSEAVLVSAARQHTISDLHGCCPTGPYWPSRSAIPIPKSDTS